MLFCPVLHPLNLNQLCVCMSTWLYPPILFLSASKQLAPFVCYICMSPSSLCPLPSFLPPLPRFSLLLLEFGEIYFEDFSAIYYPNASTESESIDRYMYMYMYNIIPELMSGLY